MRIAGKTLPGSAVRTRVFRRKPSGTTLADELRSLESRARQACAADGTGYSRALLAARTGVSKETLGAWIDGERVPQDSGNLMKAVAVMSGLSGRPGPDETRWRDLWEAARCGSWRHGRQPVIRLYRGPLPSWPRAAAVPADPGRRTGFGKGRLGAFGPIGFAILILG